MDENQTPQENIPQQQTLPRKQSRVFPFALLGILFVIFIAAAVFFIFRKQPPEKKRPLPIGKNKPSSSPKAIHPPASGVWFGAYIDCALEGCADPLHQNNAPVESLIDDFESATGKEVALLHHFGAYPRRWSEAKDTFEKVRKHHGAVNFFTHGVSQDSCQGASRDECLKFLNDTVCDENGCTAKLSEIAKGVHDEYFRDWARNMKNFGSTIFYRLWHEQNGNNLWYDPPDDTVWYLHGVIPASSCSKPPNCFQTPQDYVSAWKRVYGIFQQEQATNVKFVWCPTVHADFDGWDFKVSFPGDQYVDYVCLDGYNFGLDGDPDNWKTFSQIFESSLADLERLSTKPIIIGEFASAEDPPSNPNRQPPHVHDPNKKASWIKDAFNTQIKNHPRIKGFLWFDINKDDVNTFEDLRITSSPHAKNALREAISSTYYLSKLD